MSGPLEKKGPPLKFLLEASDNAVGNFELAKLGEVADLRREMLTLFDRLVDVATQAVLAAWLRTIDRNELRRQLLESPDTTLEAIMAEARAQIRNQGRGEEEAEDYGNMPTLSPEERRERARRRSLDWEKRNLAQGKCQSCTEPVCRDSTRYCEKHLAMKRDNQRKRLGTVVHGCGKHPNTLAALKEANEKRKKT